MYIGFVSRIYTVPVDGIRKHLRPEGNPSCWTYMSFVMTNLSRLGDGRSAKWES